MGSTAPSFPYRRTEWGIAAEERFLPVVHAHVNQVAGESTKFAARYDYLAEDIYTWQPTFAGENATFTVFLYHDQLRDGVVTPHTAPVHLTIKDGYRFRHIPITEESRDRVIADYGSRSDPKIVIPSMERLTVPVTLADGFDLPVSEIQM